MPYVDQGVVANSYNFSQIFNSSKNTTAELTQLNVLACPSDPNIGSIEQSPGRRQYNYCVNWGNTNLHQTMMITYNTTTGVYPAGTTQSASFMGAPFLMDKSFSIASITDDTSNTLLMAGVRIGADVNGGIQDHRGDIWNDDYQCAMFTAFAQPDTTFPDWLSGDCNYPYGTNPPRVVKAPYFSAARSYHSGGVNTLMADGHVQFVKNSIAYPTWRMLGSSQGSEVLSADSY